MKIHFQTLYWIAETAIQDGEQIIFKMANVRDVDQVILQIQGHLI